MVGLLLLGVVVGAGRFLLRLPPVLVQVVVAVIADVTGRSSVALAAVVVELVPAAVARVVCSPHVPQAA